MKKLLVIVISLILSIQAFAEVGGSDNQPKSKDRLNPLPHCVNQASDVDAIKAKMKANSKTANKYDGYKKALASDSDTELAARLVYAETKATRCEKLNSKVVPVITEVIANRIKIRSGDIKSVVFQRDQFASSLNIYDESNYKDFLCPDDEILWNQVYNETHMALSNRRMGNDTVNYFLYKHSPRWTKEPWKLAEDKELAKGNVRDCIRAFKNPNFK